jgi:SNF2 family DNA or RNA helicase
MMPFIVLILLNAQFLGSFAVIALQSLRIQVLLQDVALLKSIAWRVLICDEAQRLKNQQSRFYKELIGFHMMHTILLSGTPLQNNIAELYALLVFMDSEKFSTLSPFPNPCIS